MGGIRTRCTDADRYPSNHGLREPICDLVTRAIHCECLMFFLSPLVISGFSSWPKLWRSKKFSLRSKTAKTAHKTRRKSRGSRYDCPPLILDPYASRESKYMSLNELLFTHEERKVSSETFGFTNSSHFLFETSVFG